jgi:type I restriction enzyme S subunit
VTATWERAMLKDVCLPVAKADPAELGREAIRYIDIGSVDGARHMLSDVPEIQAAEAPSRCRQIVHTGDTVFSTVRPYLEKIAYVDGSLDGEFASTGFCVLRPGPCLLPKYLYYFSISPPMLDQVLPYQKGVSYPAVLDKEVRATAIPLPPLDEQQRIVTLLEDHLSCLDAADAYVRSATQRLADTERSALDRLFGGQDVPLADLVDDISAGKSYGATNAPAADDEWGIIKVSAMTWGKFDPAENKAVPGDRVDPRFEIREGDLLVSRANTDAYVGASVLVGRVRSKLLLSDKSLRLSPAAGVRPDWLWRALQAPSARRQISALATGTKESMRNISQSSLMRVRVPRATAEEQTAAVSAYTEIAGAGDRLRTALDSAHRRSAGLRRSLLTAAFSGQLTAKMLAA